MLPPRPFVLPGPLGWMCNLLGIAYVIVTTVLFLFPPTLPVTGSNMSTSSIFPLSLAPYPNQPRPPIIPYPPQSSRAIPLISFQPTSSPHPPSRPLLLPHKPCNASTDNKHFQTTASSPSSSSSSSASCNGSSTAAKTTRVRSSNSSAKEKKTKSFTPPTMMTSTIKEVPRSNGNGQMGAARERAWLLG